MSSYLTLYEGMDGLWSPYLEDGYGRKDRVKSRQKPCSSHLMF